MPYEDADDESNTRFYLTGMIEKQDQSWVSAVDQPNLVRTQAYRH